MSHDHDPRDEGIALITALFAVAFLTLLATLFLANALSQSTGSRNTRDFETAVHVAESGTDRIIAVVNERPQYVSNVGTTDDIVTITDADLATDAATEAWVRAAVDTHLANGGSLLQTARGEAFSVRPCLKVDTSKTPPVCETPSFVIVSIGWVPDRATATEDRVVKILFDNDLFIPAFALQVDCDPSQSALRVTGSSKVDGIKGDVHVNCDIESVGASWTITGKLSSTGTVSPTPAASQTGSLETGVEDQPTPEIDVLEQYTRAHDYKNGDPKTVQWWDLCPDGTIRWPEHIIPGTVPGSNPPIYDPELDTIDTDAGGAPLQPANPCANPEIRWQGQTNNFLGWKFINNEWKATDVQSGVFYVHHSNASVNGGSGKVSVFVSRNPANNLGGSSGNFSLNGNPKLSPALGQTLFLTDRDMVFAGTPGTFLTGFSAAHEQVDAGGNANYTGSVLAQNATHTPGSPVDKSQIRGNFLLTYDDELEVFLSGIVRVVAWNEF